MDNYFTVLVLSDAHIGHPKYELDARSVRAPLLKDIASICAEHKWRPNLVIFGGDLAFGNVQGSTLDSQYTVAKSFLDTVYEAAGAKYDECPLLIVPGNHDVDRSKVGSDQQAWIEQQRDERGANSVADLMQSASIQWDRFLERQLVWWKFAKQLPSQPWTHDDKLHLTTGILTHCDATVGVAGFNSSWASSKQNEKGMLWLGRHQLQTALERLDSALFKIAIVHHPLGWLNSAEESFIKQRIRTHFQLLVHGHDHTSWFEDMDGHVALETGACYQGSEKANAYAWLRVNFGQRNAAICLRKFSNEGAGGWVPFSIPGKTETAPGIFPIKNLFAGSSIREVRSEATIVEPVPGCRIEEKPVSVNGFSELIHVLQQFYGFRWEPFSRPPNSQEIVVYWPVRLRHPTPIHAVQSFVAAALHRVGARIILCLDDLGTQDHPPDRFLETVQGWFHRVHGEDGQLECRLFSELGGTNHPDEAWRHIEKWLGHSVYKLDQVLEVSKLLSPGMQVEDLNRHRPRRLLTPAVVWMCLSQLHTENVETPIVTLGGFDEHRLWRAWRECMSLPGAVVAHLYIPALNKPSVNTERQPIHMATGELYWNSRDDVRQTLIDQVAVLGESADWRKDNRIIPWSLTGCVLLPEFVAQQSAPRVASIEPHAESSVIVQWLVDQIDNWLFKHG